MIRFRVAAALAITFWPVAVEPVNEILRMSGCLVIASPRSLAPAMTLRTPRGSMSFDQLGEQRRQRGGRRGLDYHRVAGEQGRRQLEAEDEQWIVPRHDRADHAERAAMGFDFATAGILITRIGRSSERR